MNSKKQTNHITNDERIKQIPQERLQILLDMAELLSQAPQNQKPAVFLSLQKKASAMNISFNKEETDLLISVLTEGMSAEELKKVQMIRKLTTQMNGGASKHQA